MSNDLLPDLRSSIDDARWHADDLLAELDGLGRQGLGEACALAAKLRELFGARTESTPMLRIGKTDISAVGVYETKTTLRFVETLTEAAEAMCSVRSEQDDADASADAAYDRAVDA